MPASSTDRHLAAAKFAQEWAGRGQEDMHDQTFWNQFLGEVMGVARVHHEIDYQKRVTIPHHGTKRIDAYIAASKVLIEQKSQHVDLDKPATQSDGEELTAYEQAVRYAQWLPVAERPDWIVVSNFASFRIYDTREDFNQEPICVTLDELPSQLPVFDFLVRPITDKLEKQKQVDLKAAQLIGDLYRKIAACYPDPKAARHDLAVLMVRLLFCLYAEDSGLFDPGAFSSYLQVHAADITAFRYALINIFAVLDTPPTHRAANLDFDEALVQLPYVNGGLFSEDIVLPQLTAEIRLELIVNCARAFDWSQISPVIFGSIFESILSGDERRAGGMHYTSPANIHKVIDPLFLDELRSELNAAGHDKAKLLALQDKMASLKFLDPACGSGNFLTQTYIDLRRMENDILERLHADGQMGLDYDTSSFIKVNVGQFYGIEINDFAVSVASTALWIADHQANQETSRILDHPYINLPLKKLHNIICENALRHDWNNLLPAGECNYVMGNPPFLGGMQMNTTQKEELRAVFNNLRGVGELDYVCGWYAKAAAYIKDRPIYCALVSTNSIAQGLSVGVFWRYLFDELGITINFAYQTFIWDSETKEKAHVHCVIVGFGNKSHESSAKFIYTLAADGSTQKEPATNINGYLSDEQNYFISERSTPISDVPPMRFGSMPRSKGFTLTPEEKDEFIEKNPLSAKWIHPYWGADELLKNNERFCLWLVGAEPAEIAKCPLVVNRINQVRDERLASKTPLTQKFAETPTLFAQIAQPDSDYIMVPRVSSEKRDYIPLAIMPKDIIASDLAYLIPNATLYHLGVLSSKMHNAWARRFSGRLKSDYRYAKDLVYNTFVWPDATKEQQSEVSEAMGQVLAIRKQYQKTPLGLMYRRDLMPPDLLKAHKALDRAIERAYGVNFHGNEEKIVAHLFKLYSHITKGA